MIHRWTARAIGLSLAAALAVSTPAQATEIKPGHVIAGLAGAAILAQILRERREAEVAANAPQRRVAPAPFANTRRFGAKRYRQCLRQRWTRQGWETFLGPRCVARVNAEAGHHRLRGQNRFRQPYYASRRFRYDDD